MKNVSVVILLAGTVTFFVIPPLLMVTNEYAYVRYMIFLDSPIMQLLVCIAALVLSVYTLKKTGTNLSNWKTTLLCLIAMASIVGVLVQLYKIFVLSSSLG